MIRFRLLVALGFALLIACMALAARAAGPADPPAGVPAAPPAATTVSADLLSSAAAGRIHPALRRALATARPDDELPIIVEWAAAAEPTAGIALAADRPTRRRQVVAALQAGRAREAAALRGALAAAVAAGRARDVRAFWIAPVIALRGRPDLIAELAGRDDVAMVRLDAEIRLPESAFAPAGAPSADGAAPWNLALVRADLAAAALGLDGTGVVVANLDTGVDWQHPALLTHYRGYRDRGPAVHVGNWHVSTNEPYFYPGDGHGHGTHTMGTIVGDDAAGHRVGVAPGARWIAVKLFTNGGTTYESWIHDAFEWIMAPEGDPDLAPDVVNNSWGDEESANALFRADVRALRDADILPVFAAGNSGPRPGSINSPASYPEALAVAAVDAEMRVAAFSSRGPSPWGDLKPEVAAPGVQVVSAFPGGGWASGTGTSMAAPHVTGLAALLRQALPTISADRLAGLIQETARPLGEEIPNNDTGWGLADAYAAGLRVTAHGEVAGRVQRADGAGIPRAQLTLTPHAAGQMTVFAAADAGGAFTVALRPGLYDVTGRAFGFADGVAAGVQVTEGRRAEITLTLAALPAGSIFGRVTDQTTAAPLSATITVAAAPVQAQSDPTTGLYSLALPEGTWTLRFAADAHRIVRRTVTVTASAGQALDVALPPAPRILLVDSGPWYYDSRIGYFSDALEALDYPARLWPIRNPADKPGQEGAAPDADLLAQYDIVIWSAPLDSPGLVAAGNALRTYTVSGGRVLLSGQDIAYFDGGGSAFDPPQSYFFDEWGLRFEAEGDLTSLIGAADGPLAGITVTFNTADSARNQLHPDQVRIRDPLRARPLATGQGGEIGAALVNICRPYGMPSRAAWLGFGLEGVGPRETRIAILERLLEWFATPPPPYGLHMSLPTELLIGPAGQVVTATLHITNTGILSDTFDLSIAGGPWPAALLPPTTPQPPAPSPQLPAPISLGSCAAATVMVQIAIPADAAVNARAAYTITARSRGDPALVQTAALAAKTPAPVLFVDDERWYHHHDRYTAALDALGVSYDVFDTGGGNWGPPTDTLKNYALAVWTTGYDWYRPLAPEDERRLSAFLDAGGRLLLTGQDILDVAGLDDFVRGRLGVADATLSVTTTEVLGLPAGPLGHDLGPWRLLYPFTNWSDAVVPARGAQGLLMDEHRLIAGVANSAARWRTAFFPFPLETLDDAARQKLLGRTLLWLSPLGESRLEAPSFAAEGSRIPITLTLGLAADAPRSGLRGRLPIPSGAAVAPDSVRGPWRLEADEGALVWAGALAPGATLTLTADLILPAPLPDAARVPLRAHLYAGNGLTVTADADVFVDVPWLVVQEEATPGLLWPGETAHYTITVRNIGLLPTTARLTDTLPAEIRPVAGSAWASRGAVTATSSRVRWSDVLAPGEQAQVGFSGTLAALPVAAEIADRVEVTDDRGRRIIAWAAVRAPARTYLPVVWR